MQPPLSGRLALYVHIPFCESKCPYCDFNTYAGIEPLMPSYVSALAREIEQWGAWLDRPTLASVFFGGGTPSYLPPNDLQRLMETIRTAFLLPDEAEATLEANPGDCTSDRLLAMHDAGFNRISIGVQSFDDAELTMLGRRHDAERAAQAVRDARSAGFDNVSIDLMFGLPDQPVVHVATLRRAGHPVGHGPSLRLRPHAGARYTAGGRRAPRQYAGTRSQTLQRRCTSSRRRCSPAQGCSSTRYPTGQGRAGRAPTTSPTGATCHTLGVGPGAHSYLYGTGGVDAFGVRFANVNPPRTYIGRVGAWQADGPLDTNTIATAAATGFCEPVSRRDAMAETMMMGLRLNAGVADASFRERFGEGIADAFPGPAAECIDLGLLEWAGGALRLTEQGRLLGNEAFSRFVASA